jgi:hypothetical protein
MSIKDAEEAKERQEQQRAERRGKEAQARPDPVHRAIVFLLRECMQNNPDAAVEAKHHLATLDKEFANPEKVLEIEHPPAPDPAATAGTAVNNPPAAAPDTAAAIRQSKRFKRNG